MRPSRPLVLMTLSCAGAAACSAIVDLGPLGPPDGAAADVAAGDAAAEAAPTDAQPAGCVGVDALLCEDFEHGLGTSWSFDLAGTGSDAGIDDARANTGSYSLHVHDGILAPDAGGSTNALLVRTLALPANAHVRFFAWVPSLATSTASLFYLQNGPSGFVLSVSVDPSGVLALKTGSGTLAAQPFPVTSWVCIEVALGPTQVTVSQNDQAAIVAPFDGGTFVDTEYFGLRFPQATGQPPADVWIDDIVIADGAIGCAR